MKAKRMFAVVDARGEIVCVDRSAKACRASATLYVPASIYDEGRAIAWNWALKHSWRVRPVIVRPERKR